MKEPHGLCSFSRRNKNVNFWLFFLKQGSGNRNSSYCYCRPRPRKMKPQTWRTVFLALIFILSTRILLAVKALEAGCAKPLGLISGATADWQISASSSSPDSSSQPKYARVLTQPGHAWCAARVADNGQHWVMVDLGVETWVAGLIVQGREGDGGGTAAAWTTACTVSYSSSSSSKAWKHIHDAYGAKKVFRLEIEGEHDGRQRHPVTMWLEEPLLARFVRVHPLEWVGEPCLRLELLGCRECASIVSGPGSETRITASTSSILVPVPLISCQPEEAHLETHSGWCAGRNDVHQWLQFEFSAPTLITGVVTRGHGGHSYTAAAGSKAWAWVTSYTLSYSNDSLLWYSYKDLNHNHAAPKVFGGNMDRGTERRHYLNNPFTCRVLRLHPAHWHGAAAMRAAVIGCPAHISAQNLSSASVPEGDCPEGFFRMKLNPLAPCIQNFAYRKEIWTNDKKHFWPAHEWKHGHVSRAVDGNSSLSRTLSECAVLDNYYAEQPVLMVDLGRKHEEIGVEGVVLVTWQGEDGQSDDGQIKYEEYVAGLESISVYVSNVWKTIVDPDHAQAKDFLSCGTITRENNAIFAPKLFFTCLHGGGRARARYVYVKPRPWADAQARIFNFVICQVYVY